MDERRSNGVLTQTADMSDVLTAIDPELPVCWENPHTIRIGFDRSHAQIAHPSPAVQRLIHDLRRGILCEHIADAARNTGVTEDELQRLLEALTPVLVQTRNETTGPENTGVHVDSGRAQRRLTIRLHDDGRPLRALQEVLRTSRFDLAPTRTGHSPDLAVYVERFLEPLERAERLLAAGIPHLLIRFSDQSARVGPIVVAPGHPCHGCISLTEVDADPALPALAAQLVHETPGSETPLAVELVSALVVHTIHRWQMGDPGVHCEQFRLQVRGGLVVESPERVTVRTHPRCGCGGHI